MQFVRWVLVLVLMYLICISFRPGTHCPSRTLGVARMVLVCLLYRYNSATLLLICSVSILTTVGGEYVEVVEQVRFHPVIEHSWCLFWGKSEATLKAVLKTATLRRIATQPTAPYKPLPMLMRPTFKLAWKLLLLRSLPQKSTLRKMAMSKVFYFDVSVSSMPEHQRQSQMIF